MLAMPEQDYGLDMSYPLEGTLLAFDFGSKKMGMAVGQTITMTATALDPIKMQDGIPNWDVLTQLIKKWQPCAIVVGMPYNEDRPQQQVFFAARKFARRLQQLYKLPVFGMDEHLTSFAAREQLRELGGNRALEKNSVDSIAAQIILESWLRTYCCG